MHSNIIAQTSSVAISLSFSMSFAGQYLKPGVNGPNTVWKLSCPVAASVVIVLPWKEFTSVIIVLLPSPYLSYEYFLANLIAPSFASAPELPKNTFFIPVLSQSIFASLAQGSV